MGRNKKIQKLILRDGYGIEIGPSYAPIAPKKEGFSVEIIDHADRETLIEKYSGHKVDLGKIEEVDYVWTGQTYAKLTGKTKAYDWVIASHVIEHSPDLIAFLNDCDSILKPSGTLALAIPDKRFCFDMFRPISSVSSVVDANLEGRQKHTPGNAAEFYLNAVSMGGKIAWPPDQGNGTIEFIKTPEEAKQFLNEAKTQSSYIDLHAWCFTPSSFRLLIHDLNLLGMISLKEMEFDDSEGGEFYISLSRTGKGPNENRQTLAEMTNAEQALWKAL